MLKKEKPQRKIFRQETVIHSYIVRPLAFEIVRLVYNTNITPNQLTVFRIILNIVALIFITSASSMGFIVGFILFQLHEIIDHADGMLARMKGMISKIGVFLECFFDGFFSTAEGLMGFLFAYAGYKLSGNVIYCYLFAASSIGHNVSFYYRNAFFAKPTTSPLANLDHDSEELKSILSMSPFVSFKNLIFTMYTWRNQFLLWGGLFYLPAKMYFGVDSLLIGCITVACMNQLPWMKYGYSGFKSASLLDKGKD